MCSSRKRASEIWNVFIIDNVSSSLPNLRPWTDQVNLFHFKSTWNHSWSEPDLNLNWDVKTWICSTWNDSNQIQVHLKFHSKNNKMPIKKHYSEEGLRNYEWIEIKTFHTNPLPSIRNLSSSLPGGKKCVLKWIKVNSL